MATWKSWGGSLSKPTFGDLLDAVLAPWAQLRQALGTAPRTGRLAEVDRLAEQVLLRAEQLTANLENRRVRGGAARHQRRGPAAHGCPNGSPRRPLMGALLGGEAGSRRTGQLGGGDGRTG